MGRARNCITLSVSLVITLLLTQTANAQGCGISEVNNSLDCIIQTFQTATRGWETTLRQLAFQLFSILVIIELTFAGILLVIRGADFSEWMSTLLNQILFIGFFAALLKFSSEWSGAIVASFREAANLASGIKVIAPSDIFDLGLKLASSLLSDLSVLSPVFSTVLILASFFLMIAFGLIAATLIVALVEAYIVISAGVLMMGFGGSRWTKDYAVRTFQYALSVGAKLFVIQLLAGLMMAITQPWHSISTGELTGSWTVLLIPLGVSIIFVSLIRTIPELVQGIINGTSLTMGTGLYGTTTGFATGASVATISGGMAATSSVQLAGEQLKAADADPARWSPQSTGGRIPWQLVAAGSNLAEEARKNIGRRLSGDAPPIGTRMGQMAGSMDRRREEISKKLEADETKNSDVSKK